jgi:hypothetical protein
VSIGIVEIYLSQITKTMRTETNSRIKRTFTFKKYENQIKLQSNFKKCVVFGNIDLSLYRIDSYERGKHNANGSHLTFDNFDFVSFICESRHPITKVNYTKFACSINEKVVIVNAVKSTLYKI